MEEGLTSGQLIEIQNKEFAAALAFDQAEQRTKQTLSELNHEDAQQRRKRILKSYTKTVYDWDVDQVVDWANDSRLGDIIVEHIKSSKVNGTVLLQIDEEYIEEHLKSAINSKGFLLNIANLRRQASLEDERTAVAIQIRELEETLPRDSLIFKRLSESLLHLEAQLDDAKTALHKQHQTLLEEEDFLVAEKLQKETEDNERDETLAEEIGQEDPIKLGKQEDDELDGKYRSFPLPLHWHKCEICLVDKWVLQLLCGHNQCLDCLSDLFLLASKDGTFIPVKCCKFELDLDLARFVLDVGNYLRVLK